MKVCQYCGSQNDDTNNFCGHCGNKLPQDDQQAKANNADPWVSEESVTPVKIIKPKIVQALVIVLIGITAIGVYMSHRKDFNDSMQSAHIQEQSDTEIDESTLVNSVEGNKLYIPSDDEIISANYITLFNNFDEYRGKYIRLSGKIHDFTKNDSAYTIEIYDTLFGTVSFDVADRKECQDNDPVVVVGIVDSIYLRTITLTNAYIEAIGEDAEEQYAEVETARSEWLAQEKADFIASCSAYDYEELARYPNKYTDNKMTFTGEVVQSMKGLPYQILRIDIGQGNILYVEYHPIEYTDNEGRILENDTVTVYGVFNGIKTYRAVLGNDISIPYLVASYVEIQ